MVAQFCVGVEIIDAFQINAFFLILLFYKKAPRKYIQGALLNN